MRWMSTAGLFGLLLIHALLLPAVMHRIAPAVRTAPDQLARFASRTQSADSWEPMGLAEQYAVSHRGVSLYDEVFFRQRIKFQYPPTSLMFVRALSRGALNAVSWASVWVTVIVAVLLFRHGARMGAARDAVPARGIDAVADAGNVGGPAPSFLPLSFAHTLAHNHALVD